MDLWWFFKFFCDAFCLFICCCLVMVTTFISKVASAQDKVHATYIIFHSLWWLHWLDVAVCTNVSDALIVCFWRVSSGGLLLEGCFWRVACRSLWYGSLSILLTVMGALSLFEVLGVLPMCWDSAFLLMMVVERRLYGTSTCDTDDWLFVLIMLCMCVNLSRKGVSPSILLVQIS